MEEQSAIIVEKGRTCKFDMRLAYSVLGDTITSEIRAGVNPTSPLIATWNIEVSPNGRKLTFTLDDDITKNITVFGGYMDLKRVTGGEPVSVLDNPIPVIFKNVVTA
jgi:hypothetical protein